MFVQVMTDMGMGRMTNTKIGIRIRIRSTPIRIPTGYTRTRVNHYMPMGMGFYTVEWMGKQEQEDSIYFVTRCIYIHCTR